MIHRAFACASKVKTINKTVRDYACARGTSATACLHKVRDSKRGNPAIPAGGLRARRILLS